MIEFGSFGSLTWMKCQSANCDNHYIPLMLKAIVTVNEYCMNKVVNTLVWCFVNDFQPLNSVPYLMCKLHSNIVTVFREVQQINLQLFGVLLLYQSGLGGGLFSNKRLSMFIIYCNRWWKVNSQLHY